MRGSKILAASFAKQTPSRQAVASSALAAATATLGDVCVSADADHGKGNVVKFAAAVTKTVLLASRALSESSITFWP